jgi:hypothetical protein
VEGNQETKTDKKKQLGITLTKMYWLLRHVKTPHKQQTSHIYKNNQTKLDIWNTTMGYGFHFKHRNSIMFPIESGRTLVGA